MALRVQDAPLRVLCSYYFYKQVDMEALAAKFHRPPRIFADSGGFSAFSQGVDIDINHYAWWLNRWRSVVDVAANLDDLHDPVRTWKNQQHLEREGLNPIPVFHLGSHFDWLRKYLDLGYKYLALGKLVGRPLPAVIRFAVRCFKIAKPYGAVFHGFGLTRTAAIQTLPFYSVDSSTWGQGHRWGKVTVWDPARGKMAIADLRDPRSVARLGRHIRAAGFDPGVFSDRDRYRSSDAAGMSAVALLCLEQFVRDRLGPVPLPAGAERLVRDSQPGLAMYLADGSEANLVAADEGLRRCLCRGAGVGR